MSSLVKSLIEIQNRLKVPKSQFNEFGGYHYRSAEDILEAVKPLNAEKGLLLTLTDEPVVIGDRHYIKATATITDGKDSHSVTAYAREAETRKKQDESQITGTASSYARKYALNGLYLIDDTKDADTNEFQQQTQNEKPKNCNKKPNINTIKAKYEAGKGSLDGFDEWYKKMRSDGLADKDIDAVLTERLIGKQRGGK